MSKKYVLSFCSLLFTCISLNAQIACRTPLNLALDIRGVGTLSPAAVLVYVDPSYTYTMSKSVFNCNDIWADQTIYVYQSLGGVLINSCSFTLHVEDKNIPSVCLTPPIYCRTSVNVLLNPDGRVSLSPAEVVRGPLDPDLTYTVSPSSFDCSNVGPNMAVVTVTTTAGVTNYCTFTVNVFDNRPSPPPCVSLFFERIRFIPDLFYNFPVPPLSVIGFEAKLSKIMADKKLAGEMTFVISEDEQIDQSDIVVFSESIKYPKKSESISIQGKFVIPSKIKEGKYFLLADIMSKKKKIDLSIATYVQPFEVGNPKQNKLKNDQLIGYGNTSVYPNPFQNNLFFENDKDQIQSIKIYNIMGQNIKSINLNQNPVSFYEFDLSEFQKGVYLINISHTSGQTLTKTILKQ